VNGELGELESVLPGAVNLLKAGGRLAVITFHSLEDRIVKNAFRLWAQGAPYDPQMPWIERRESITVRLVNRKPLISLADEIARNPRARSAKLRIVERL
jgi:16S rRNA (cytosine1402-N4)-methyltransferase